MKKNFFKKLSFVLALAMIVSTLAPAAGVFAAAKTPKINTASKVLTLGETNEYDFHVDNKVAGSKYAWVSDNKAVATVDQAGLTTGLKVGTANITVKVKTAKKTYTTKAVVTVKDNIKSMEITNLPTDNKLVVGTENDFNRSYKTFSGATKGTTSKTYWTVSDTTNATISAAGVFKATKPGDYTITANAFQSSTAHKTWLSTNNSALVKATKEYKVTVVNTMKVAQKDLDSFTATFDSAMTDVSKNISLFKVVGTTETAVTNIKAVTMSTDNMTATVDLYVPFTEGATYVVKYTNVTPVNFTAATAKAENVVGMSITTTEAVINEGKALEVALTDVNGVNIANTDLLNRVEFAVKSDKAVYYESSAKKIYFYTKGDTATVTATYHTYKFEAGKEVGNLTATGTVTGVDKASLVAGAVKAWTLVTRTAGTEAPDYSNVKQVLSVSDNKRLFAQLNTTTGTTTGTVSSKTDSKVTFESSDSTICMIDSLGNLYPVKAGEVVIVVKYDTKAVDTIKLTVNGERKAAYMELSATDLVLSNVVTDTAKVTVKVKDQLGEDLTVGTVVVTPAIFPSTTTTSAASAMYSVSGADVTFNGLGAVKGSYQFKVVANDQTRYVAINVVNTATVAASSYNLDLSTRDADSKVTTDTQSPSVTINLFGYADGVKVSLPGVSSSSFKVEVTNPDNVTTTLASTTFNLTNVSVSGVAVKVKLGQYKVTAYQLKTGVWVPVDYDYFTVKDTQTNAVLAEVKATTYTLGTAINTIASDCFKLTFNGNEVAAADITMGDNTPDLAGTQIYVKNVIYTEMVGSVKVEHKVSVERYVYSK